MTTPTTRLDTIDFGKFGKVNFLTWVHEHTPSYLISKPDEFERFIPPGSFAVDIGSYTGDTTIPMALCAGTTGKVVAFEPSPVSYGLLRENIKLSGLPIDAHNCAVTNQPGESVFHFVDDRFINGGFSTKIACGPEACHNHVAHTVKTVTLREFLQVHYGDWLPKFSFLKIDTEGYDKEILKANVNLIMKYRPVIQVEAYPFLNFDERQDLIDSIKRMDYHYTCPEHWFFHELPYVYNIICLPN